MTHSLSLTLSLSLSLSLSYFTFPRINQETVRNLFCCLFYQLIILCIPLITFPLQQFSNNVRVFSFLFFLHFNDVLLLSFCKFLKNIFVNLLKTIYFLCIKSRFNVFLNLQSKTFSLFLTSPLNREIFECNKVV